MILQGTAILNSMNQSVNPCDNFYQYACGKFVETAQVSDDEKASSFISNLVESIKTKMKENLENETVEDEPQIFKKLKAYYKACLDEGMVLIT